MESFMLFCFEQQILEIPIIVVLTTHSLVSRKCIVLRCVLIARLNTCTLHLIQSSLFYKTFLSRCRRTNVIHPLTIQFSLKLMTCPTKLITHMFADVICLNCFCLTHFSHFDLNMHQILYNTAYNSNLC